MFFRRKILVLTGVFLLIVSLVLFYPSANNQLHVTPTIIGNNYRLLIELPHDYIDLKCSYQGQNQQPRLLKIADGVNLYEVLLSGLDQGEHSCQLFFERNDSRQTEMQYYFTITGSEL